MNIFIGCDHGGFHLKNVLVAELTAQKHQVFDQGAKTLVPDDDYPDIVVLVGQGIQAGRADRGILICGSGVGASIAANKMHGIRAAICHDAYSARQGVEDDDMNVLCMGGRVVGEALALELVAGFLAATFSGATRHCRRLAKVEELDATKACADVSPSPSSSKFGELVNRSELQ